MGRKHNGSLSTVKPIIQELGTLVTRAFKPDKSKRNTILNRASTILGEDLSSPTALQKAVKDLDPAKASTIRQLKKALTTFAFTSSAQDSVPSICPTADEMSHTKEPDVDALLMHLRMEQMPDDEILGDDDESPEYGGLFTEHDLQY